MISNHIALVGSYSLGLVALSVVIAICASYAALDLAGRVTTARGRVRVLWTMGGATTMGLGIWSMHYIGMLAFRLPIPVFYHWPTVVLSLLAAILASAVALYVVSRERMGAWRAGVGSIPMGGGIAAMHYIGMDAMRLAAMCHYDNALVALSVVLAIVISFVALWLAFLSRVEKSGGAWQKIGSAVVMGATIPVMHYTGLAAASFMPWGEAPNLSHAVDISALGMTAIVMMTLMVLGLAVLTSLFDRRRYLIQKDFSRDIIDCLPGIFYVIDEHGQILRWNNSFEDASGYSAEEISRMSVLDFIKETDKRLAAERMQQAFSEGAATAEVSFVAKDQTETPYMFSGNKLVFEGKPCLVGLAIDITERKQAERLLRDRENKHRVLFDESADANLLMDEKGFVDCNSAALQMFRYPTKAELITLRPAEISPPSQTDGTPSRTATDEKVAAALLTGTVRFEWLHQRKDGEVFPAEVCLTALTLNGQRMLLATVRDVTGPKRAEEAQHKSAEEFRAAFEDAPFGMSLSSLDSRFLQVNQAFCQLLGYSKEELLARDWHGLTHSDDLERSRGAADEMRSGRAASVEFEKRYIHKQGDVIWVRMRISVVRDGRGEPSYFITHVQDITERIKAEERAQLWSQVLDQSAEGIIICDPQERILLVNKAFEKLAGFSAEEVLGKTPRILQSGRQDRAFYANMWKSVLATGSWQGEVWNRRKNGEIFAEWLSISTVHDNQTALTHYVGIFSDITVHKQDAERMAHLAHYDTLTDLPNRVLLMDRLNQLTKSAERRRSKVALFFIDLDRFKDVNDSLGHQAGDLLLQTVAKRFSSVMRAEDTLARIGGDEFVAIFQGIHDGQDASIIAKELISCLIEPLALSGHEVTVTASMGISLYPDDATDGHEMIRNADAAMYQAKGAGRNAYQFYTTDLNQHALEMLSMESGLRRAIERQEFVLYYQPQVDIASGSVVGAEALIRWNHPELGLVMPGKFISIAEERGLIVPIGNWTIDEAARQAAIWQNQGTPIRIAVNVSAVQFRQKDFVEQLANKIQKHGIAPAQLEIELTERIIMRDAKTTIEILEPPQQNLWADSGSGSRPSV